MKDATRTIIGILVGLSFSFPAFATDFIPGEVIVKFKAPASHAHSAVSAEESRAITVAVEDTESAISELNERADVEYVEPNYIIEAEAVPNDWPYAETVWADVELPGAWDFISGSESGQKVTIAVIDSGVDLDHPDLQSSLITGYDYANNDSSPEDDTGHGTRVCGIIGALGDNGTGVAGLIWNIDSEIMPVKFMKNNDGKTTGTLSDAINSIYYAVDHGADIINASWGFYSYSRSLEDAVRYAMDNGVLFIASAGNKGQDNDLNEHYPSNYPLENVIAVAAMSSSGDLASFSNYGLQSVHIAAPGVGLSSTDNNGGYVSWISGTSYAAPFVAGIAAMVRSQSPDISYGEVRDIIISTVTKESGYRFNYVASGGCINAYQALLAEQELDVAARDSAPAPSQQTSSSDTAASGEGGGGGGGCMIDSSRNTGSALSLLAFIIFAVAFRMPRYRHLG